MIEWLIDEEIANIEGKIRELQNRKRALEAKKRALAELPETCPSCKGSGKERYTDAAGDSDWRECMTCRGLGKVGPIKCTGCGRTIDVDMVHVRRQPHPCYPWCGTSLGGQYSLF